MTVEKCLAHCRSSGLQRYAGVKNGDKCLCGGELTAYSRYGKAPETECNKQCKGDKNQICGGKSRNAVYDLGMFMYLLFFG